MRRTLAVLGFGSVLGQDCGSFAYPKGIRFNFADSVETVNNLGGIAGGSNLICSQNANSGGPDAACGFGCGCTNADAVAPPGTPQELRFRNVGQASFPASLTAPSLARGPHSLVCCGNGKLYPHRSTLIAENTQHRIGGLPSSH